MRLSLLFEDPQDLTLNESIWVWDLIKDTFGKGIISWLEKRELQKLAQKDPQAALERIAKELEAAGKQTEVGMRGMTQAVRRSASEQERQAREKETRLPPQFPRG